MSTQSEKIIIPEDGEAIPLKVSHCVQKTQEQMKIDSEMAMQKSMIELGKLQAEAKKSNDDEVIQVGSFQVGTISDFLKCNKDERLVKYQQLMLQYEQINKSIEKLNKDLSNLKNKKAQDAEYIMDLKDSIKESEATIEDMEQENDELKLKHKKEKSVYDDTIKKCQEEYIKKLNFMEKENNKNKIEKESYKKWLLQIIQSFLIIFLSYYIYVNYWLGCV